MPKQLVDLTINEVSGVDKAANKRTFLVIKSENSLMASIQKSIDSFKTAIGIKKDSGSTNSAMDVYQILQQQAEEDTKWDRHDAMYALFYPLMSSVDSICCDPTVTDKVTAVKTSLQQFSDLVISSGIIKSEDYFQSLIKFKDEFSSINSPEFLVKANLSLDDDHITALQQCIDMVKSAVEALPNEVQKSQTNNGGETIMTPDEIKKAAELKKAEEAATEARIQKAVDEALAKANAPIVAENATLKKQLEDIQKAQSEQLENLQKASFINLAKSFGHVEGDSTKLGDVLFKCSSKLDKADYDVLEGIFKTSEARIVEGDLLKEAGTSTVEGGNSTLCGHSFST